MLFINIPIVHRSIADLMKPVGCSGFVPRNVEQNNEIGIFYCFIGNCRITFIWNSSLRPRLIVPVIEVIAIQTRLLVLAPVAPALTGLDGAALAAAARRKAIAAFFCDANMDSAEWEPRVRPWVGIEAMPVEDASVAWQQRPK